MGRYRIIKPQWEEIELPPQETVSIAEAARLLGLSIAAAADYLDRGGLTTIIDTKAKRQQGRRLFLRRELEELLKRRETEKSHRKGVRHENAEFDPGGGG